MVDRSFPVSETPDIVERIRARIMSHGGPAKDENGAYIGTVWPMMLEAADEIEHLRNQAWKYLQECGRLAQCSREPAAWRTMNDHGHWYYTDNPVLADTWMKIEKFDVQPLYVDTSTVGNSK